MDEFSFEERAMEPQEKNALFFLFSPFATLFPTNTHGVTKVQCKHKPYFNRSLVLCNCIFLHVMHQ